MLKTALWNPSQSIPESSALIPCQDPVKAARETLFVMPERFYATNTSWALKAASCVVRSRISLTLVWPFKYRIGVALPIHLSLLPKYILLGGPVRRAH